MAVDILIEPTHGSQEPSEFAVSRRPSFFIIKFEFVNKSVVKRAFSSLKRKLLTLFML